MTFLIKRHFLVFTTVYAMISNFLVFFCALTKMLDLDANICALEPTSLLHNQVRAAEQRLTPSTRVLPYSDRHLRHTCCCTVADTSDTRAAVQ